MQHGRGVAWICSDLKGVATHLISPANAFFCHRLTRIEAGISNHIHMFIWDVNTHHCIKFNDGLTKPPMKLGQEWVMTSYYFVRMQSLCAYKRDATQHLNKTWCSESHHITYRKIRYVAQRGTWRYEKLCTLREKYRTILGNVITVQ